MFIEWNSINSVNVKEIDIQHKILISIINRLDDVKNTGNLEAIRGFLDELKDLLSLIIRQLLNIKRSTRFMSKKLMSLKRNMRARDRLFLVKF